MAETIFDVVVVGGGPAGYTFAIRASQYGLKVALVDSNDRLGGTCLLWGCIPTKAMLFTAEIWDHLKHAKTFGIAGVDGATIDWKGVLARKDDVIARHTKGLDFLMKKNKITTFKGFGRLTGGIGCCSAEEAEALLFSREGGLAAYGSCHLADGP